MTDARATLPDTEEVLAPLKDFQRKTVDYVFRRLYLDDSPTERFLVADEVGLGKTLVARGVIARTLEHLAEKGVKRLDVVYVCSNAAIARQNINRLNVTGIRQVALPTRLSLLPLRVEHLDQNRINFISLTPGTSLDPKSRGGVAEERLLLHAVLQRTSVHRLGLFNLLQGTVGRSNWHAYVDAFDEDEIDPDLSRRFLRELEADEALFQELKQICNESRRWGEGFSSPDTSDHFRVIGKLRKLMAEVCIHALEPDLIILDEFQRFRDILTGDGPASELTHALLDFQDPDVGTKARVLLLSATPYRPLTLSHEEEDYYEDFLTTCGFLLDDQKQLGRLEAALTDYRRGILGMGSQDSRARIKRSKDEVERILRSVMVRTERIEATRDRDAMLEHREKLLPLEASDLAQVELTERVAQAVDAPESVEYWKSAPYLLNVMREYKLKERLAEEGQGIAPHLARLIREQRDLLLQKGTLERYDEVPPANARLRGLMDDLVEGGLWRLLWMPPSLPYLAPGGPYADLDAADVTKGLIFSTWKVVPDAVAALCSYEVERRMLAEREGHVDYSDLYEKVSTPLRFRVLDGGRYTGMYALLLLFPSTSLAEAGDPLRLALSVVDEGAQPPSKDLVADAVKGSLMAELSDVFRRPTDDASVVSDHSWYWRAVARLERASGGVSEWAEGSWFEAASSERASEGGGLSEHITHFAEGLRGELEDEAPKEVPHDLDQVLVELALGSPAVCALRALQRIAPSLDPTDPVLLSGAARVAGAFMSLFNLPETIALLGTGQDVPYWRRILRYAVDGNLQAVLDEYAHVLSESLGLMGHDPGARVEEVAATMADVLGLRTSRITVDEVRSNKFGDRVKIDPFHMRSRFALRFGDLRGEGGRTIHRADTVRQAFNSPFRPFVLASTSIGQEGLDFHNYCHAVYHWNLPSNPVDLEQREGRVHRYKGHAIRKNVAHRYGLERLRAEWRDGDPWQTLFSAAVEDRPDEANDLIPFWIYEDGPARIERRVPMLPYSREVERLRRLRRGLAVYRLAFGQPRQEDLVRFLADAGVGDGKDEDLGDWMIRLGVGGD